MGLWEKFKLGLKKTSSKIETALRFTKLDDDALQDLEEALGNYYSIMCREFQKAYVKVTFLH